MGFFHGQAAGDHHECRSDDCRNIDGNQAKHNRDQHPYHNAYGQFGFLEIRNFLGRFRQYQKVGLAS